MNSNTQLAQRKENLSSLLGRKQFQESLKDVLPKHLTPERVVKMALVAASRQPKLYDCTPQSFLQSVMTSAELGLDCTGTLGQGYLIPFWNGKIKAFECQFMAGYQGLISLARRSGNIARIESRIVYEKDRFDIDYGTGQRLVHKPYLGVDKGEITCVYAIAELTGGGVQLEIMTIDEIKSIRDRSKAKDSGPWVTDFGEMARKTVIRRIAKYLPLSPELVKAIETDDRQFDFTPHGAVADEIQVGVNGLKERLKVESKEVASELDPKLEAKAKAKAAADIKATKAKAKKEKAKLGITEKEATQTADEKLSDYKYKCNYCEQMFNEGESAKNPQGVILCPNCLTSNVTDTTKEPAEQAAS